MKEMQEYVYSNDDRGLMVIIELESTLMAHPAFSESGCSTYQAQSFPRHRACFSSISEMIPESLITMSTTGHISGIPDPF